MNLIKNLTKLDFVELWLIFLTTWYRNMSICVDMRNYAHTFTYTLAG